MLPTLKHYAWHRTTRIEGRDMSYLNAAQFAGRMAIALCLTFACVQGSACDASEPSSRDSVVTPARDSGVIEQYAAFGKGDPNPNTACDCNAPKLEELPFGQPVSPECICALDGCPTFDEVVERMRSHCADGRDVTISSACGILVFGGASNYTGQKLAYRESDHALVGAYLWNDIPWGPCGEAGYFAGVRLAGIHSDGLCSDRTTCSLCKSSTDDLSHDPCMIAGSGSDDDAGSE